MGFVNGPSGIPLVGWWVLVRRPEPFHAARDLRRPPSRRSTRQRRGVSRRRACRRLCAWGLSEVAECAKSAKPTWIAARTSTALAWALATCTARQVLPVGDSQNDRLAIYQVLQGTQGYPILCLSFLGIGLRVMHMNLAAVLLQLSDNIDHPGIT